MRDERRLKGYPGRNNADHESSNIECDVEQCILMTKSILDHQLCLELAWLYITCPIHSDYFPNMARKLRLLPILCTFSAFLSIELFSVGMGGTGGLFMGGVGGITLFPGGLTSLSGRSLGFGVLRLRLLIVPSREFSFLFSSPELLLRFSISPSTVVPLVARYSSAMPTKRTTPRSGDTPRASLIKA